MSAPKMMPLPSSTTRLFYALVWSLRGTPGEDLHWQATAYFVAAHDWSYAAHRLRVSLLASGMTPEDGNLFLYSDEAADALDGVMAAPGVGSEPVSQQGFDAWVRMAMSDRVHLDGLPYPMWRRL